MCYNFATFVLYLDVITLIYRENRLTSSETSLSAINPEKSGISRNLYTKMYTKRLNLLEIQAFVVQK